MNASIINGKESNPVDEAGAYEIGKSAGSLSGDGDEVAQFQADQFIADQFRMVTRPKKKRPKEVITGLAEAVALQEHIGFRAGLSPFGMDDNHNTRECGTIEDTKRRILDILENPIQNEPGTPPINLAEVKMKELDTLLKESFEAYNLRHYSPAATKYKMAWEMITDATLELRLRNVNEHIVCYMLCLSLLKTNEPNNLLEAVKLLVALEKRSSSTFPAVYYALSLAHHKHYRFALALKAIEEGFANLKGDVKLTEYTIPGSNDTLKESTKDGLSVSLAAMKDECSKWHPPDAVCCMSECLPNSQWYAPDRNIYFGDPTFNGMVVLTCSNARSPCTIKFHQACWKLKKDQLSALKKLSDKDITIAGYECFTPNCEYDQGSHSLITTIEVYGDDGKLKTRVDAPANPVVWGKRRLLPKGAVPKQQMKPKRPVEKLRRPVATALPRPSSKEAVGENRTEWEWRLAKLAKLRQNNFGIKPDCEWRPDVVMYGNPQMMEIGDFLGGPIFENDDEKMAAIKMFVFTYFYEFIKENGCVKRNEISQKWEEDKFIFDNYSDVLYNETDICEFLLQSFKLVSLGDYVGIAENLPQLYTVVRTEVCSCLRFLLADSFQSQTAVVPDDVLNVVCSDYDERTAKLPTAVVGRHPKTKTDAASRPDKIQQTDGKSLLLIGHCKTLSTTVVTMSQNGNGAEMIDYDNCQRLENEASPRESITEDSSLFTAAHPGICNDRLIPENSDQLEGVHDLSDCQQRLCNDNYVCGLDSEPNSGQVDSKLVLNLEEEEDSAVEQGVDSVKGTSSSVCDEPHDSELTDHSLLGKKVFCKKSDILDLDFADHKPDISGDCGAGINGGAKEIAPQLRGSARELRLIGIDNDHFADGVEPDEESPPSVNTNATDTGLPECSSEEQQHCDALTGTMLMETVQKPTAPPNALAESNVQEIESDLAFMAKTVAQLKSVLEQNRARSENHAQMLQQEFLNHKKVSQEGMSELVKDFNRLEARCAQLESEKSEIMHKYQEYELDLRHTSDDNETLKLKNTELTYKYDKLGREKTDLEHNLDVMQRQMSVIENNLETLQRERDKMDKKLQKYHARLKDKSCADAEMMSFQQKEQRESEQRILDATRLSERKSKLQCLTHEFSLNKYALEKAFERCYDHINMLNDVSKLVTLVTGQQFVMTEPQVAWQETDYFLRHTVAQYKGNYTKLKALLESDEEIENLDDIKLPTLNIPFPQPPNLTELYYTGKAKFVHHQIPVVPTRWAMQGVHQHQDSHYLIPAASAFYLGQNFESRVNANTPAGPALLSNRPPQNLAMTDVIDHANQRSHLINGADCQRGQNTVQRGPGIITVSRPQVETEEFSDTVAQSHSLDTEKYGEGVLQASQCTTAMGTNPSNNRIASPIPVIRRPTPSKKIGKDLLIQELKKKFVGVPELDLLDSVDDVRKLHNDALSGMRVEDIIRESEPFVKQRQEKHMAYYLQSRQMLPPERSLLPPSKTNQRKLPSSTPLGKTYPRIIDTVDRSSIYVAGQQKKIQGAAQGQPNTLVNYPSNSTPDIPAAMKKPAWGPVASGLVDWIKNEEDSECTICFESMSAYNKRAPIYVLPCQHSFHTKCIKKWLGETSVCPICRTHCTMDDEFPPLPS